jgi:hypothetical protein
MQGILEDLENTYKKNMVMKLKDITLSWVRIGK